MTKRKFSSDKEVKAKRQKIENPVPKYWQKVQVAVNNTNKSLLNNSSIPEINRIMFQKLYNFKNNSTSSNSGSFNRTMKNFLKNNSNIDLKVQD